MIRTYFYIPHRIPASIANQLINLTAIKGSNTDVPFSLFNFFTDVIILNPSYSEADIINFAGSIEKYSEHPIAKGIVKEVKYPWEAENFKAISGQGAEGKVKGKAVKIVSPGYLKKVKI